MFCSRCGSNNDAAAKFCHSCGNAMLPASEPSPVASPAGTMRTAAPVSMRAPTPTGKNPVVAALLCVLIVGGGQLYNGDIKKGIAMFVGAVVLGMLTVGVLWVAIMIWSAVDAYQVANGTGRMW